jgi:hypothetical protein
MRGGRLRRMRTRTYDLRSTQGGLHARRVRDL